MEPGCPFAAKHTEFTSCRCEWLPIPKQSQQHDCSDDVCVGRDQFLEANWYSDMREWAAFNKHAQLPDSPLASDSLSSVSTRESSFFSWNSEHSQTAAAATQGLLSPEVLSSRFSGFSLFNSRIGHVEEMSCGIECARPLVCESHSDGTVCQEDISITAFTRYNSTTGDLYDGWVSDSGEAQSHRDGTVCQEDISITAFTRNNSTTGDLYDGWVRDSGEAQSCLSTPSQELAKDERIQQANDMPVGRQANHIHSGSPCIKGELPISMGFPTPLRPRDAVKSSSHAKSRYSAAVKEKFASSTLHGFLRFAEQGGSPCYSFFVDDSDEVLFARASRQERQSNKVNCDWTYSFHSKKDNGKAKAAWKGRPKKESLASDLVGNMSVPVVGKATKNRDGREKEAHFVLYDGRDQQHVEGALIGAKKHHTQPLNQVCDNKAASQGGHANQKGEHCCRSSNAHKSSCNLLHEEPTSGLRDSCSERYRTCFNHQAELAAVVISTSVREKGVIRRKEGKSSSKETAGWGVKFLDKGSECGRDLSFMERASHNASGSEKMLSRAVPDACKSLESVGAKSIRSASQSNMAQAQSDSSFPCPDLTQKPEKMLGNKRSRLHIDVTVILPAGDHGLPTEEEEDVDGVSFCSGPTPLLERWASGGDCACGNWDMGCGLSIFKAETLDLRTQTANIALTRNDRMNWLTPRSPFRIFTQGYKKKKVLVIEMVEAGLFSLSFQARLSPLQAFFIAVALFHQQMTDT